MTDRDGWDDELEDADDADVDIDPHQLEELRELADEAPMMLHDRDDER
jgi:hypothetical protein